MSNNFLFCQHFNLGVIKNSYNKNNNSAITSLQYASLAV